jgi:predicted membrane protein
MERTKNKNIVFGVLLAIVGGVLLLKNLDMINYPLSYYLFSWKTLLVVIGIFLLGVKRHLTSGIILISLGIIFWLPQVFNHQLTLHQILWPSILVVVGILLLLKASGLVKPGRPHEKYEKYKELESTELPKTESH